MSYPSFFKALFTGLVGAVIGVIFVAIANLVNPIASLVQLLIIVSVPAFLSAIVGHVIGANGKDGHP
ncbi:MAG TPA: hypothetical protein VMV44_00100 [Rectinemataceae bacterium]|nr:hypothetical protein [Rectinemataceae bacterium]